MVSVFDVFIRYYFIGNLCAGAIAIIAFVLIFFSEVKSNRKRLKRRKKGKKI